MTLLALETATSFCSAALFQGERVTVELTLNMPRAHSEHLVPMIDEVFRRGAVGPRDVDVVAVSSGPGSYTGLRIGVSTAKGLASAIDAELVAVPSLEALAAAVSVFALPGDRIAAAFDARRDEVYAAVFHVGEAELRPVKHASAVRKSDVAEWLGAGGRLWLVGDGWETMPSGLEESRIRYHRLNAEIVHPSAGPVARLGAERARQGDTEDLMTFEPYYLKEFVAAKPKATAFEKLPF